MIPRSMYEVKRTAISNIRNMMIWIRIVNSMPTVQQLINKGQYHLFFGVAFVFQRPKAIEILGQNLR